MQGIKIANSYDEEQVRRGLSTVVDAVGSTPIVGHVPLTALDLHLDPGSGELLGNPDSPDEPLYDALSAA